MRWSPGARRGVSRRSGAQRATGWASSTTTASSRKKARRKKPRKSPAVSCFRFQVASASATAAGAESVLRMSSATFRSVLCAALQRLSMLLRLTATKGFHDHTYLGTCAIPHMLTPHKLLLTCYDLVFSRWHSTRRERRLWLRGFKWPRCAMHAPVCW